MEYICSDTNIWIDYMVIGKLDLPFRLPFTYQMNQDAVEDELLSPKGLKRQFGLVPVELRKVAQSEGVTVMGTIGLLDRTFNDEVISTEEYKECLNKLKEVNGREVLLPLKELQERLNRFR